MADRQALIDWPLTPYTGWGGYGIQLAQALIEQRKYWPCLLASNDRSALCDLHWLDALQHLENQSATLAQRLAAAEGATIEIHAILQRMREIAVQASNGSLQDSDRAAINSEFVALEAEINRINDNTTWAGQKLTDGTLSFVAHVGPDASQTITHTVEDLATTAISLVAAITMATRAGADAAITAIDKAISQVGTEREQMGAVMNRLDHAVANLTQVSTNLQLAKGRIEDADFAAETSNLARTQVLQQASMAMLAQANASKQNILALFQ